MLSRGKLVQDWRRRLAAAEAEEQEQIRLRWLIRMRVRLYRFLLSCYRQGDWRADAPSVAAEETLSGVPHGDTTTILDCPLDGKPAKTVGKMQAVLKSVSAAQDHPPESGPLLGGIAADEWVVAVSVRDKLKMQTCEELLRRFGIDTTCTKSELKVRHFDMDRAVRLIRSHRDTLKAQAKRERPWISPRLAPAAEWPVRLAVLLCVLAPAYAISSTLVIQCLQAMQGLPIIDGSQLPAMFGVCYFGGIEFGALQMWVQHILHWRAERRRRGGTVSSESKE